MGTVLLILRVAVYIWSFVTIDSTAALHESVISSQQCYGDKFHSCLLSTLENKALRGSVIKTLRTDSILSCAHQCLRQRWCVSTNFDDSGNSRRNCELNKKRFARNKQDEFGRKAFLVTKIFVRVFRTTTYCGELLLTFPSCTASISQVTFNASRLCKNNLIICCFFSYERVGILFII